MAAVRILSNTSPCFCYSGKWCYSSEKQGETCQEFYVSTTPFSSVKVHYYGTSVALYGYKGPAGGMIAVSVDYATEITIDTYSAEPIGTSIMIAHVFAWSHFHALHIPINYTNSARNPVTQYIPLWNDKNPPGNNPATWIMDMEVYGYSVYSYDSVVKTSQKYGGLADTFGAYIVAPGEWGYQYHNNGKQGVGYSHPPQNKLDAFQMIEQYFMQRVKEVISQGKWLCPMTGHYMYAHYAGVRAGMKMISTEVGENIKSIQARVAFTRGAARQFGLAFGIQFSPWYGPGMLDYSQTGCWAGNSGPCNGHSLQLFRRAFYYTYLCGAEVAHLEGSSVNWFDGEQKDSQGCFSLSPLGWIGREFFTLKKINRGIPFVPVAVMLDKYHGLNGLQVEPNVKLFYGQCAGQEQYYSIDPTVADKMNTAVLNTIWPGSFEPSPWDESSYYFTNSSHPDIYDVIMDDAPLNAMGAYNVIYVSGDVHLDMNVLMNYVCALGGTLIINSRHLTGFSDTNNFLGTTIQYCDNMPAMKINGVRVMTNMPPSAHKELTYPVNCTIPHPDNVCLTTAQPLMVADNGATLATINHTGHGRAIVTTVPYLACKDLINVLLLQVEHAVCPISVNGDVQVLFNKADDGWFVLLINNCGVTKEPTMKTVVDFCQNHKIAVERGGVSTLWYQAYVGSPHLVWSLHVSTLWDPAYLVSICLNSPNEFRVFVFGANTVTPVDTDGAGQFVVDVRPGDLLLLKFQHYQSAYPNH